MAERSDKVADTKQYRFIGSHAEVLAGGRPVEPGEYVDLTDEEARDNKDLLGDEVFLEIEEDPQPQEVATEAAHALADERGIDLSEVSATGADGKITKTDVERHISTIEGGEAK